MINIGTFCSGIGSPEQALKKMNINHKVKFACEIDKFARITYLANNETELMLEDITNIDFNSLSDVDIFIAGFPCQSFSIAGLRKGFDDIRGNIFFHILEYLKIKRPSVFILENVPGLLSHDGGSSFDSIIKSLSKTINGQIPMFIENDSLGYHVYYKVLNATDYGIPQNRERIFIIGFREDNHSFKWSAKQQLKLKLKDLLEDNVADKYYVSDKALQSLMNHKAKHKETGNGFGANILNIDKWSNALGVAPASLERNLISPTIRSRYFKDGSECLIRHSDPIKINKSLQLKNNQETASCKTGGGHSGGNHSDMDLIAIQRINKGNIPQGQRVYNSEGLAYSQTSNGGGMGAKTGLYAVPILTTNRRNNVNNFKSDNNTMFSLTAQSAHGIAIPVLTPDRKEKRQNGRSFKEDGEPMFTLTSQDKHGVYDGMRVRRLTPREAFRLFGFPDSFKIDCVSDSQAYKQAGNTIVINVLEAIFKEILVNFKDKL